MNPVFKKHLDRRTFLRGAATVLGLPMLDAMVPALSSAATKAPLRMAGPSGRELASGPSIARSHPLF